MKVISLLSTAALTVSLSASGFCTGDSSQEVDLRISQLDGRVTLTLPKSVSDAEGIAFAREKEVWLRGHLDRRGEDCSVEIGARLPIEGAERLICAGPGRRVTLDEEKIFVPGNAEQVPRRLQAFLKQMARDKLAEASDHYAGVLGKAYTRISIRDTRSRWGSCITRGGKGHISYSWRLVCAPPFVLDYVAAHECAHMIEANHSAAYWAVVDSICDNVKPAKQWLRKNGALLHAVGANY